MNRNTSKKIVGSKSTLTLKIKIPAEVKPLLDACASFNDVSPEGYILAALAAALRCDVEYIYRNSPALAALEKGQA